MKVKNISNLLKGFFSVVESINREIKQKYSIILMSPETIHKFKSVAYGGQNVQGKYICLPANIQIHIPEITRNGKNPIPSPSSLEVVLEVDVTFNPQNQKKIINPLASLKFVVSSFSNDPSSFHTWHLDGPGKNKEGKEEKPENLHPIYHLAFGGSAIEDKKIEEGDPLYFGKTLFISTPRFMHPPMDIILGMDFIVNHYLPQKYAALFLGNETYQKNVNEMKELLWGAYAFGLAKNYCTSSLHKDGNELDIDDFFSKSIIGYE